MENFALDKNDPQQIKIANLDNFDLRAYSAMFYPNHEIGHFYPWQIYPCLFYPWIKMTGQNYPRKDHIPESLGIALEFKVY